jgi:hypothetical protein
MVFEGRGMLSEMVFAGMILSAVRAISSVVERCPDKTEVLGPIPRSPTCRGPLAQLVPART